MNHCRLDFPMTMASGRGVSISFQSAYTIHMCSGLRVRARGLSNSSNFIARAFFLEFHPITNIAYFVTTYLRNKVVSCLVWDQTKDPKLAH